MSKSRGAGFSKCGLMPSGPVAESESRFVSKLSTLSGEKDTDSRNSWMRLGKVGTEGDQFGTIFRSKHGV